MEQVLDYGTVIVGDHPYNKKKLLALSRVASNEGISYDSNVAGNEITVNYGKGKITASDSNGYKTVAQKLINDIRRVDTDSTTAVKAINTMNKLMAENKNFGSTVGAMVKDPHLGELLKLSGLKLKLPK